MMRLKKLRAALFATAALGAVLTSSAVAAATTTDVQWYTGASPGTLLSGSATLHSAQVGAATLATTVSGTPVVIHSTGINCVGCTIQNSGGTAVGSGELEFTGVTVTDPPNCTTASTITTNPLKIKADYMIGTVDYLLFEPSAGSTTTIASPLLSGNHCLLDGFNVPFKGTVFVQAENATGVQAATQTVSSSAAINTAAGGSLHVGPEVAALTGTVELTLNGGAVFGTH